MKYTELQQKELLLKYISIKLSNELNNDINLEYIIKYNDKIITGTTLRNFNTTNFSVEKIFNDFNRPEIIFEPIDYFYISENIKPFYTEYLAELSKLSKINFKSALLKLILDTNINLNVSNDNFEMYNVRFIENNIALDYLLISEKDNFEIISVNIID
jgi:hypothetical protein